MVNNRPSEIPKIIDYDDYRSFLKDKFEYFKRISKNISYRYLAAKVGTTDNYFKYVLDRQKNIGINRVTRTAKVFQLNQLETQYLLFCAIKAGTRDTPVLAILNNILTSLKKNIEIQQLRTHIKLVSSEPYEDNHWLRIAIKKISSFANYKNSAAWVHSQLHDSDIYTEKDIQNNMKTEIRSSPSKDELMPNLIENFYTDLLKYTPYSHDVNLMTFKSSDIDKIHQAHKDYMDKVLAIEAASESPNMLVAVYGAFINMTNNTNTSTDKL